MTIICLVMYVLRIIGVLYFITHVFKEGECTQEAVFRRRLGKYLPNHVLRSEHNTSEFECLTHCMGEMSCASVNHKILGVDAGKCELNSKALQETSSQDEIHNPGFNYLDFTQRDCQDSNYVFSPDTKLCLPLVPSCKELLLNSNSLPNGEYTLRTNVDSTPYKVYCHMTDISVCGGGGWTLVLKVDGRKQTFKYDSPLWTNKESYTVEDGLEGLTEKESKLASYWNVPFKKICLGMTVNDESKWMMLDYAVDSLHSVIADGQNRPTSISLDSFKSLIPGFSMQPHCNRQGFNVNLQNPDGPEYTFIRFGLLANNEDDCNTCDSWIGLGAKYFGCSDTELACGNRAICGEGTTVVDIPAFGYLLVQ